VNAFERDALEVLRLVRSLKNSLAPINRIPPEVLSRIPGYCDDENDDDDDGDDMDQDLITLTHVCRGWRDVFTSCSSLWTRLDLKDVEKTRTYIQRSQSSPLEIFLEKSDEPNYPDDAFSLVVPHLRRLKSLAIDADVLPDVLRHFCCQAPLLEELNIFLYDDDYNQILDSALFGGDLSSLCKLTLNGAITIMHLPWNNMANLKVLNLRSWVSEYSMTRLLDFFESAPLLHTVELEGSIPDSSDAPPQRIVPLPYLKSLIITADTPPSILLNHLCIPTGASLILKSNSSGDKSPLLDCFPEESTNLKNLSHITMVNLNFDSENKFVQLNGPSGSLRVLACWVQWEIDSYTMDCRILHSLPPPILSTAQRLAISNYTHPDRVEPQEPSVFQTLSSTNNLQTLILTKCDNLPFILALDPEQNPSKLVLCPKLEEIVLYVEFRRQFRTECLISMVKNRALRGTKLSLIITIDLDELAPDAEVFGLREHVTHVKFRVGDAPPTWDHISGESGDKNE